MWELLHVFHETCKKRESNLSLISGFLGPWLGQIKDTATADRFLGSGLLHGSYLFPCVAAPSQVQSGAEISSALRFHFNLLRIPFLSESLVQKGVVIDSLFPLLLALFLHSF